MSVWGSKPATEEGGADADAAPSDFPTLGGAKEAFPSLGMAAQVRRCALGVLLLGLRPLADARAAAGRSR